MSKAFGFTAFGGPETQELLDRPVPVPGPGELLIAVRAAGVNPADWKMRRGLFSRELPLPAVLGYEVAGVVQEAGDGAGGFAAGDAVFGIALAGGYAEHTLLAAANTARKPEGVSFVQAAALPVAGATAYDGVQQLGLEPGRTLLILGIAGGVGSAAAQIARARGITVLGTASDPNRAYVESLGATQVRYGEGVAERIRAVAPGGVDGIFDLVGGADARAAAETLTDPSKLVSTADSATAAELGGSYIRRTGNGATLAALAELVASGDLDPNITATYPLERAGEALAEVESRHAHGKLVIEIG
ncbi:NADP-dependent oxidoreductase [Kitasatospora atroaurantiaca]|uniref:NADPH:quinone reductase-like Zn-dependent oxidoreductase n=1 Tax=Kitasatospora atroaurantiaca TaxID=285545 RepID=A0A561EYS0_9ACTN|nr:NADP-dependent oxidoreductase [Kitasatospora atroaurantiaca]TWE20759.1 NADPH:quinone reductase-like Zn-dependent oxidoreductase [Kitasatospora atroaurantiaca]